MMVVAAISMVTLVVMMVMMLMIVRTMLGTGGFAASSQRSIETDRSSQGCSGVGSSLVFLSSLCSPYVLS